MLILNSHDLVIAVKAVLYNNKCNSQCQCCRINKELFAELKEAIESSEDFCA